jgi:hypothetical protein
MLLVLLQSGSPVIDFRWVRSRRTAAEAAFGSRRLDSRTTVSRRSGPHLLEMMYATGCCVRSAGDQLD